MTNTSQTKTLHDVYLNILSVFPFRNEGELNEFKKDYLEFEDILKGNQFSDLEFFNYVEEFIAILKNAHTILNDYPNRSYYKPKDYIVEKINKDFHLFNRNTYVGKIIKIGRREPLEVLNDILKRISASTKQYGEYRALLFMLASQKEGKIRLVVETSNNQDNCELTQSKIVTKVEKTNDLFELRIIDKIGYLKITTWLNTHKDQLMKFINESIDKIKDKELEGLIIDIRNNHGGNSNIATYLASKLFNKKVLFGTTKTRTSKTELTFKENELYVEPTEPYINLPLVLLVNEACLSSSEYFIAGLKDNKRAYVIGQQSGGSSGNPIKINIRYKETKFSIMIATWRFYRANKNELEGQGIKPDLIIDKSLDDLIDKDDIVLEKALAKIKNPSSL